MRGFFRTGIYYYLTNKFIQIGANIFFLCFFFLKYNQVDLFSWVVVYMDTKKNFIQKNTENLDFFS